MTRLRRSRRWLKLLDFGGGLRRALLAEGLPGPVQLSGTLRVARWLWIAEMEGRSLCQQMLASGADPSVAYRLVRARTGLTWRELRQRGTLWFVNAMVRPRAGADSSRSKGESPRRVESGRRA